MISLASLAALTSSHTSPLTCTTYTTGREEGEVVLVISQTTLDTFLLDVPVRVFCQEDGAEGLNCRFFSLNKRLVEERTVKNKTDMLQLLDTISSLSLVACQGVGDKEVLDWGFRLEDVLVEKYMERVVVRSRNCQYLTSSSSTSSCDNCRMLQEAAQATTLTLTIQEDREGQKVLVAPLGFTIPDLKIPSLGSLEIVFTTQQDLEIVEESKVRSRGRPVVAHYSCPGEGEGEGGCSRRFSNMAALNRHKREDHVRRFRCSASGSSCTKSFMTELELEEHQKVHYGILPFTCGDCGHRFLTIKSMKNHRKLHSGLRPHQCDVCDKKFVRKDQLQVHKTVHTGEKGFLCGLCGISYTRQTHLIEHNKRVHLGEKRFSCSDCNKAFFSPQQLQRHSRVHNGDRPYECEVCGRKFSRSHHLKAHNQRIHQPSGDCQPQEESTDPLPL